MADEEHITSFDEVVTAVDGLRTDIQKVVARLDQLVASHNQVGENVAWLTANTQGIFAMLNDPKFISQMMGGMMSGMGRAQANAGQDRSADGSGN